MPGEVQVQSKYLTGSEWCKKAKNLTSCLVQQFLIIFPEKLTHLDSSDSVSNDLGEEKDKLSHIAIQQPGDQIFGIPKKSGPLNDRANSPTAFCFRH